MFCHCRVSLCSYLQEGQNSHGHGQLDGSGGDDRNSHSCLRAIICICVFDKKAGIYLIRPSTHILLDYLPEQCCLAKSLVEGSRKYLWSHSLAACSAWQSGSVATFLQLGKKKSLQPILFFPFHHFSVRVFLSILYISSNSVLILLLPF